MVELKIGDLAPDIKSDSTNGPISLEQLKGKNVILYFYPKDMTPGCTTQAREFMKIYDRVHELNTEIVGISRDDLNKHHKFCEKEGIKYPLLLDTDSKICNNYGVIKEKTLFGKKYLGINRSTFLLNKDHKVEKIWKSVKASGHAEKVLEAILELN